MVVKNDEEARRVMQEILERRALRKEIKAKQLENDRRLKSLESLHAYLTGNPESAGAQNIPEILEKILRESRRPLHAKILVEAVRRFPGFEETAHQTVTGALIRLTNQGKRFTRVAPNTYDVLKEK